jgi:16S rRNA processing protein RimM
MDIGSTYKIGFILRPHGLKGEVTISLDPEAPAGLSGVESVFVEQDKRLIPFFITAVSATGKKAFVKFEDVDNADAAEAISKRAIYLPKSSRPKSSRGEFYDDEVVGFTVTDEQLGELGTVTGVADAGANRLLILMHAEKEVLIPVNSPFVLSINKSKKKITVDLPDGFLDI